MHFPIRREENRGHSIGARIFAGVLGAELTAIAIHNLAAALILLFGEHAIAPGIYMFFFFLMPGILAVIAWLYVANHPMTR